MLLRLLVWATNHRVGQVFLILVIIAFVALMIVIESAGLAGWE